MQNNGQGNTFKCELCNTAAVLQTNDKCNCEIAQNLYLSTYSLNTSASQAFAVWKTSTATPVTWGGKVWRCDLCLDSRTGIFLIHFIF